MTVGTPTVMFTSQPYSVMENGGTVNVCVDVLNITNMDTVVLDVTTSGATSAMQGKILA